jgi:triosephosphate isomerase (TIM)
MRKKIIAANWKMNTTLEEAKNLLESLKNVVVPEGAEVILNVPFIHLYPLKSMVDSMSGFSLGAQHCSEYESGAYTGEISVNMLKEYVKYVIVGHSERRDLFDEDNEEVKAKVDVILKAGLTPIFCCGESRMLRETEEHLGFIQHQLAESLFHLTSDDIQKVIIAYEPIWAIGTGLTATKDEAQEMHAFIRTEIEHHYTLEIANSISILYGGSCNGSNSVELFAQADIDGGLVGGASLKGAEFGRMVMGVES